MRTPAFIWAQKRNFLLLILHACRGQLSSMRYTSLETYCKDETITCIRALLIGIKETIETIEETKTFKDFMEDRNAKI